MRLWSRGLQTANDFSWHRHLGLLLCPAGLYWKQTDNINFFERNHWKLWKSNLNKISISRMCIFKYYCTYVCTYPYRTSHKHWAWTSGSTNTFPCLQSWLATHAMPLSTLDLPLHGMTMTSIGISLQKSLHWYRWDFSAWNSDTEEVTENAGNLTNLPHNVEWMLNVACIHHV